MSNPSDIKHLDNLKSDLIAGRISRRRFMEGALALGLTTVAATSLWSNTVKAKPKKGGRFRVGMDDGNNVDSLEPATYISRFQINMAHTHRNYLTEITPANALGPELAESWEATPDAANWTFKLVKGVEFHNGKSFEAKDVVATLNYHRGEDSKSAAKSLLQSVTDIIAEDSHTVTIKLSAGSADLPYVFTDFHLPMLPSDGEGNVSWEKKDGTGGYVLEEFNPGVVATFKRFPNYWKEDRAHFDEVEFLAMPDVVSRQTALQTNEIDAMLEVDLKTVHLLGKDPNINVIEVPSGAHISLPMHVNVAPFDNNDVRMALKLAMDREDALQRILKGHGTIGNDHPIGSVLPYYAAALEQRVYDPDKAKWHLKQAGMENLTVSLSASDVPFAGGVDLCVLYKEHAQKAGITIDLVREAPDGYWSDVWQKKPFVISGWGQRPTPDVMFSLVYEGDAAWSETFWKNERFDKLLVQARAEFDEVKRGEMYYEMQQLVRDDGGAIIPFFRNWVFAARSNVMHDEQLSGNWGLDGARSAERWWFG